MPRSLTLVGALLVLGLSTPALAQSQALRPEREQLNTLVQKTNWKGADRTFRKMVELEEGGQGALTAADWRTGARIARTLGDMESTKDRLTRAFELEADDEVRAEIQAIAMGYGPIVIEIAGGWAGDRKLVPTPPPFETDKGAAIAFATAALEESGNFRGLVPTGKYTLAGTAFEVVPGALDPLRARVSGAGVVAIDRVKGNEGSGVDVDLILDLGVALTAYGGSGEGIQPQPFSGPGPRVGLGADLWLVESVGIRAELGYQGLFGGGSDNATLPSDQINLVYGWVGASYRAGGLVVAAGPQIGFGSASANGLDLEAWKASCAGRESEPDCVAIDTTTEDGLANTSLSGNLTALGITAGLSYELAELGPVRPGLGVNGGFMSDGQRSIPWGQLALIVRL